MHRFLIITKGFRELSAPNAICLKDILKTWNDNQILVDVISAETKEGGSDETHFYVYSKIKNNKLRKIKKIFTYPIDDTNLVIELANRVERQIKMAKYELLIAVVNPPEAASALKLIKEKHPEQKCCLYEIDALSNRYKFPKTISERLATWKAYKWARDIYEKMDIIVHMKSHKKHFESQKFIKYRNKSYYLDIPSFKLQSWYQYEEKSQLTFLYAGALYKDLRNPEKMIEVFHQFASLKTVEISMYINDAMFDEVKSLCQKQNAFKISRYIPENQLNEEIINTTCLISLGNKESDFLPSKVLSYMGTGKPIIHFYFDKYDVALSYLDRYPNSLCIDLNNPVEVNLNKLNDFVENRMNSVPMSKEKLLSTFEENTPEYSAYKIMELAGINAKKDIG